MKGISREVFREDAIGNVVKVGRFVLKNELPIRAGLGQFSAIGLCRPTGEDEYGAFIVAQDVETSLNVFDKG